MNTPASKTTHSFQRATWSLRWGLGCCVGALLVALASAPAGAATLATSFLIQTEVAIIWQTPPFAPSTFTGTSTFERGRFNADNVFFSAGSFNGSTFTSVPILPSGPLDILYPGGPIFSGDAIIWQFGGVATAVGGPFTADAFPGGPILPSGPTAPSAPPLITVALNLQPGFAPFEVTGPIIAFDDPVQIGTYDIRVRFVPAPSTLLLLGLGLAGLAALRRPKVSVRAQS